MIERGGQVAIQMLAKQVFSLRLPQRLCLEPWYIRLRSRLRPHRGISQELLLNYLGFFESVHNAKRRGKKLLHSLLQLFLND